MPGEVIDFSASINPLGPSPHALEAIRRSELAAYPDPDCIKLRRAISKLSSCRYRLHSGRQRLDRTHTPTWQEHYWVPKISQWCSLRLSASTSLRADSKASNPSWFPHKACRSSGIWAMPYDVDQPACAQRSYSSAIRTIRLVFT